VHVRTSVEAGVRAGLAEIQARRVMVRVRRGVDADVGRHVVRLVHGVAGGPSDRLAHRGRDGPAVQVTVGTGQSEIKGAGAVVNIRDMANFGFCNNKVEIRIQTNR